MVFEEKKLSVWLITLHSMISPGLLFASIAVHAF